LPYLNTEKSVKCKVCSFDNQIRDVDLREGFFTISLRWGSLMVQTDTGVTVSEEAIDGYTVFIVDTDYMPVKELAFVPRNVMTASGCCTPDEYLATVMDQYDASYHRFMIVPCKDSLCLPAGVLSDPIIDAASDHPTTVLEGSLGLRTTYPAQFAADAAVPSVVARAFAQSVEGVSEEMLIIESIEVAERRLEDGQSWLFRPLDAWRRLAAHTPPEGVVMFIILFGFHRNTSGLNSQSPISIQHYCRRVSTSTCSSGA
jgi:hypothetical protein